MFSHVASPASSFMKLCATPGGADTNVPAGARTSRSPSGPSANRSAPVST
jgi:hypothetical protein